VSARYTDFPPAERHQVVTTILPSLLRSWAQLVRLPCTTTNVVPWWLDPNARIDSIVRAAQALGWAACNTFDPDDPEGWDIRVVVDPETTVVIRLVGAAVPIDESAAFDTITNAWRTLALTASPPQGAIACHLVAVEPHLVEAGDCTAVELALNAWLAAGPWCAASDPKAWANAPTPCPRNAAGVIFPGVGLIARVAAA
jgi:hypothetical protein